MGGFGVKVVLLVCFLVREHTVLLESHVVGLSAVIGSLFLDSSQEYKLVPGPLWSCQVI